MSCAFEERVAAYASGEPDDELAAHLPGCAACRAELDAARALLRQVAPLARPAQADAQGELFWADFTRGVRAQLPAPPARGRFAWIAGPALAAAAVLVWTLAGRTLGTPVAGTPVPASTVVAAAEAPIDDADELLPFESADAASHVGELDEAQLDVVLARLEPEEGEPDADPFGTLESMDDDQLDAVAASFAL